MANIAKTIQDNEKLPTLADIFGSDATSLEVGANAESLNAILNVTPPKTWVKEHPYISGHFYLPIDRVEYLMRKIFKKWKVEITGQGASFNGVWVTVRLHYFDPSLREWSWQDGIGAAQLQTKKGTSPSDLANIGQGAIAMAYPMAKTEAIKDASHMIGKLFGADLNRRDALDFKPDSEIIDRYKNSLEDQLKSETK